MEPRIFDIYQREIHVDRKVIHSSCQGTWGSLEGDRDFVMTEFSETERTRLLVSREGPLEVVVRFESPRERVGVSEWRCRVWEEGGKMHWETLAD